MPGARETGGTGAVGEFVSYLEMTSAMFAAPKKGSVIALGLRPGDAALDVGCGGDVSAAASAI
jgi:hypothetical protein